MINLERSTLLANQIPREPESRGYRCTVRRPLASEDHHKIVIIFPMAAVDCYICPGKYAEKTYP